MKYFLYFLFLFVSSIALVANDSMFTIGTDGLHLLEQNESPINLVNEELKIALYDKNYSVTVKYTLYNSNNEIHTKLCFPIKLMLRNRELKNVDYYITNFETTVNNEPVSFEVSKQNLEIDKSKKPNTDISVEYWFIKDVVFKEKEETIITVSYTSKYSSAGMFFSAADYYYGSGNTWKNGIENLTLVIEINEKCMINGMTSPFYNSKVSGNWINDNTIVFEFRNLQPNQNDTLRITKSQISGLDFIDFFRDEKMKGCQDYSLLTKEQLRYVRNGFYASHNYKFKSNELTKYYKNTISGYSPINSNVDDKLTNYQKNEISKIILEETTRK